jgi:TolB protein
LQFTPPSLLAERGMLALTIRSGGYSHIWLWPLGLPAPTPLTSGEFDDRDPDFRPDGLGLAFSSRRDGNWELFSLDLPTGQLLQLTNTAGFHAHPSWSPDAQFIAYENYQDGRFSIRIVSAEGVDSGWSGPIGLESFEPDWIPLDPGRILAFTGRTGPHTDIYTVNLDTLEIVNLTNTPKLDERNGAFSPDGASIAYSVKKDGYTWTHIVPVPVGVAKPVSNGQGDRPEWSPDGQWLIGVFQPDVMQSYLLFSPANQHILSPAALWVGAPIEKVTWTAAALPDPLPEWLVSLASDGSLASPTAAIAGVPLSNQLVHVDVRVPNLWDPLLSSAVVGRFNALRQAVKTRAGWDYLGTLDSAATDPHMPLPPRELLSWFRTGRAFAVSTDAVRKGWLAVVPDLVGASEYWRLYLRTLKQDGTQGEPMRELPWNFDARNSGTPAAYDNGGQFYPQVTQGYYIDFTQLAAELGWQRRPSDSDWKSYFYNIRYWEFLCADGLDWFTAMGELYPPKDYLTPTPSASPTPGPTMRWGPPPTNTRWPTWTRTPTKTPSKTRTPP